MGRFLVLRTMPDDEDGLRETGVLVQSLVMIFGDPFLAQGPLRKSDTVVEHHWLEKRKKGGARVVVVDDAEMPARYVGVSAADHAHAELVRRNLEYLLPVVPIEELRGAARDPALGAGALARLALASDEAFDEETFALIVEALDHASPSVREDAALAALITKWQRFTPHLEAALERESGDEACNALTHVLGVLRASATP